MPTKTIHFVSLGCPKNRVDTEVMLGTSADEGYRIVARPAEAEVIVVNTCGFIGPAKEESIDTILEMGSYKESGQCKKLVVSGCLSQRYPEELAKELPEVDYFLGSSDMLKLGAVLRASHEHPLERVLVGNPADYSYRASDPRLPSQARHSVYVKIAEGCSRTCSFCIIPSMRGKQRSRPLEDIVREVERLTAEGAREINLVSQDTVSYGRDLKEDGRNLADLVRALGEIKQLEWLRLFYLYPESLTEQLIELLAQHPKVLPYVDMPLQHASERMLKLMRRGHGPDRQRRLVERMRKEIPKLTFRTAFIVGHPGETDADFEELCAFVKWAEFERVGVFKYSNEEGTRSETLEEQLPAKVINARHRKLMQLQRPISRRKMRGLVGSELEVLVEGVSDESEFLLEGRHAGQAPDIDGKVYLANGEAQPGEIRRARITDAADYDLVADLLPRDGDVLERPPGARAVKKLRLRTV
ncbi:MAG TPA: 30S ribosomal protein S12 methylthiotransferase RimO [Polyangiaceae bacterium]|nr:30S ribosomal protein S12 methylthiotransferase RimO [Polyangiaceae bacterium]